MGGLSVALSGSSPGSELTQGKGDLSQQFDGLHCEFLVLVASVPIIADNKGTPDEREITLAADRAVALFLRAYAPLG